jgi:hypothetical protein
MLGQIFCCPFTVLLDAQMCLLWLEIVDSLISRLFHRSSRFTILGYHWHVRLIVHLRKPYCLNFPVEHRVIILFSWFVYPMPTLVCLHCNRPWISMRRFRLESMRQDICFLSWFSELRYFRTKGSDSSIDCEGRAASSTSRRISSRSCQWRITANSLNKRHPFTGWYQSTCVYHDLAIWIQVFLPFLS